MLPTLPAQIGFLTGGRRENIYKSLVIMTPEQIDRCLRSIGKAKFIIYYERFRDLSLHEMQDLLEHREGLSRDGSRIRYTYAQSIFRSKADLEEALRMITTARIDSSLRQKARRILEELE